MRVRKRETEGTCVPLCMCVCGGERKTARREQAREPKDILSGVVSAVRGRSTTYRQRVHILSSWAGKKSTHMHTSFGVQPLRCIALKNICGDGYTQLDDLRCRMCMVTSENFVRVRVRVCMCVCARARF